MHYFLFDTVPFYSLNYLQNIQEETKFIFNLAGCKKGLKHFVQDKNFRVTYSYSIFKLLSQTLVLHFAQFCLLLTDNKKR